MFLLAAIQWFHPSFKNCTTISEFSCAFIKYNEVYNDLERNCASQCPQECNSEDLSFTTMNSDFPNKQQLDAYLALPEYSHMNESFFRENIVALKIYYPQLKYTEINQVLQYSFWDLTSSIGGIFKMFS